jgi:hypothetical protein
MRAYIGSHWRGEQSLGQSYWVNGVVLGIPFNIFSTILENVEPSEIGVTPYTLLAIAYFVPIIPWGVWFAVGTLRSASAHIRRTGRRGWAYAAKFIAVANLVLLPFIVYVSGVMVWNLGLAALGKDEMIPATLHINDSGNLVVEGHIVFETPNAFEQLLSENPETDMIQLESRGGYSGPALRMAALIQEKGLDTYTSYECASACTFLYIAGESRFLDFDGVLGFHQSSLDGVPDNALAALESAPDNIFLERDVPQSFLDKIQEVPSEDIWEPTLLELVKANIVTHVYDYNSKVTYTAAEYCQQGDCTGPPPPDPDENSVF